MLMVAAMAVRVFMAMRVVVVVRVMLMIRTVRGVCVSMRTRAVRMTISAALGFERRINGHERRAEVSQHLLQHMIAADA